MKIDVLYAIFADWLEWLREQIAYYQGQLSKLDEKRRKAETVAETPVNASYLSMAFGETSGQAAVERHSSDDPLPMKDPDGEPPAPTVQPDISPDEDKDANPKHEDMADTQEIDLGEEDLA